jgi:hypothetical protein
MDRSDLSLSDETLERVKYALETDLVSGNPRQFSETVRDLILFAEKETPLGNPVEEYVILTPADSFMVPLSEFAAWKESEGFRVDLWNLTEELGEDAGNPHAIRNFLQEHYPDGKLRYLLLVGHRTLIPMLEVYSATSGTMLTDYYYADLEGDWDADHDGIYGEVIDDRIDFIPEFICSRIPCKTVAEGTMQLGNSVSYELSDDPGKNKGILMAGTIAVQGETGLLQNTIAWMLKRHDFQSTRMYDTDTFSFASVEMPLYPDYLLGETRVPEIWNEGQQGFVYDISHGSPYGVMNFNKSEAADLNLELHGWFIAAACAVCGPLYRERNFAEELIFTGGASGVIGSTDIVNPGAGLRVVSGIFAEIGFAMTAINPGVSLGRAFNTIETLYYLLFMTYETDPYWLEVKGQNLKGYDITGDAGVCIRNPAMKSIH